MKAINCKSILVQVIWNPLVPSVLGMCALGENTDKKVTDVFSFVSKKDR